MAHYDDTSSNIPLSNLDQSVDKRIVDIYASPNIYRIEIEKDGKRIKKEQVLTYKEIFYTDGEPNRRIYLQGEPGSGKSTFSSKLVHDWSHINQVSSASPSSSDTTEFDDVLPIQQFQFLFFITLRRSRGEADVTQMIKKQLIDTLFSEDELADVYKLFVQIINTEICLAIREGIDEWMPPKKNESNIRELQDIWSTDTRNVQVLCVRLTKDNFLSSSARGESTSHLEFNLSSCHSLRGLLLSGSSILLRGKIHKTIRYIITAFNDS
ncbi:hypothetical protein DPMN_164862 [Dreissena polymorpha]|uniref:NACHT domain-containing protein n=1 Tax=Dreissena polymorpha TaxID=45954 RepID=A0A9D4IWG8_DREPO|nr:hypothetical protein DPMN_164862 [Dreissena polymorpha]